MRFLFISTKQRLDDYGEFVEALESLGVEAKCVPNLDYCFLSRFTPLNFVPFPRLLKVFGQFNPDFVVTDSLRYVPNMAKLVNRIVFFHMRGDTWTESYWDGAMHPSLLSRMYRRYLDLVSDLKKTDLILPNSKWLQKKVEQYLPYQPTQVLYVGIDAQKWAPSHSGVLDDKHPAAVGVFPFTIYAKVAGLLKFTRIVRKMPDVNFYFVGDGPYFRIVEKWCPPNMFLVGRVSKPRVKELLESSDIFVHPAGVDALPRSIKEASLMEKAIVASNVGGIPEIVQDNKTGYLCDINDVDQWIRRIRFLLDNPDVAKRFGKNAREYVKKKFSWRKISEDFLSNLRCFRNRIV